VFVGLSEAQHAEQIMCKFVKVVFSLGTFYTASLADCIKISIVGEWSSSK